MKLKRIIKNNIQIEYKGNTYNLEYYFKKNKIEEDIKNTIEKSKDLLITKVLPELDKYDKGIFTIFYCRTLKGKKFHLHVSIFNDNTIQLLEPTWYNLILKKW